MIKKIKGSKYCNNCSVTIKLPLQHRRLLYSHSWRPSYPKRYLSYSNHPCILQFPCNNRTGGTFKVTRSKPAPQWPSARFYPATWIQILRMSLCWQISTSPDPKLQFLFTFRTPNFQVDLSASCPPITSFSNSLHQVSCTLQFQESPVLQTVPPGAAHSENGA